MNTDKDKVLSECKSLMIGGSDGGTNKLKKDFGGAGW
jgi:hypothetical protein